MGKGYISVKLQADDAKKISDVLKLANVSAEPIIASKMHVTVMYDVSNPDIDVLHDKDKVFKAKVLGVERLGEKGSKWEAVALVLESTDLEKRHNFLKSAGFKHSYPKFKCHMSLLYKPAEGDFDKIDLIYKLDGFPKELAFDSEKCEKIKE